MGCIASCFKVNTSNTVEQKKNIVFRKKPVYSDSSSVDDQYLSESESLLGSVKDANSDTETSSTTKSDTNKSSKSKSSSSSKTLSTVKEITEADEILLESFYATLQQGLTLTLHKESKGKVKKKEIKISLVGNELRWTIKGNITNKNGSLSLRLVKKISWGKKTDVFRMPQNKLINEGCCFSLVTDEYTIDFECSSRLERDAITRGFSILTSHIEEVNNR